MEQDQARTSGRLKRAMNSKMLVWGIALLAVVLICLSATVAFGVGPFRSERHPQPSEHMPEVGADNTPSLLKVVTTDDADIANMGATLPSTAAAAALQTQDTTATPQSPVSGQAAAVGTSLSAGAVNLQAGVNTAVNTLNIDKLGL
ncbi:MAG TPA: hypothetical protein VGO07_07085 [Candidatus Saccharimonadales bacterium]|jgi:hypothetical protein|nr:hypothetical protein [Candidatus Saccharimonadales bacterium]